MLDLHPVLLSRSLHLERHCDACVAMLVVELCVLSRPIRVLTDIIWCVHVHDVVVVTAVLTHAPFVAV
jgi:hypothetical protein